MAHADAELRAADIACDMELSGRSVKAQFKMAEREAATYSITIGDSEIDTNTVQLKEMKTREQAQIARSELLLRLGARSH